MTQFITEKTGFLNWNIQNTKVCHDNDIGFDSDDYWALYLLLKNGCLESVTTTLYRPDQKATIASAFIKQLHLNNLCENSSLEKIQRICSHIFPGKGYYENPSASSQENAKDFLELYPRWPSKIFGDPQSSVDSNYKCIYPYQSSAFEKYGLLNIEKINEKPQLDQFLEWLKNEEKPILITATGPLTNLADFIHRDPTLMKNKVKAIIMMNGTFLNPPRMGYNGGLNLKDTETVFNSGIPCIIISSELCKDYSLPLEKVEKLMSQKEKLSDFGKAMLDVLVNWETHRARKKNPLVDLESLKLSAPILADPLAAFLTIHPEYIQEIKPMRYVFHGHIENHESIHLLHPDSEKLVTKEEDPNSHIFEVISLKDPAKVQQILEEEILELFI